MNTEPALRVLVVDDEPPARARLRRLLAKIEGCELAGEAGSSAKALARLPELKPDLLLLDISMPGMDGMALAATLQDMAEAPAVVFCTAWPDRALAAFDRDAVDYLVKPVRLERLRTAVGKARRYRMALSGQGRAEDQYLRSSIGGKTMLIAVSDVYCFIAEDKYTTVHFDGGKTVVNDSLVELEKRFSKEFLRVHRNSLVSVNRIRGMHKASDGQSRVLLDGTEFRPEVSRRRLSAVRRFLRDAG